MREVGVLGERPLVERTNEGWRTYRPGEDGKTGVSSPDIIVPRVIVAGHELLQYPADWWRERARPDRQTVRWIE